MSAPQSRFVIVPRRPRSPLWALLLVALWLGSVAAAWMLSRQDAAPTLDRLSAEHAALLASHDALQVEEETLRGDLKLAQRAEQVMRDANRTLQEDLRQRDEEIAALRADVGFYERLVGGSAQRQGLSVHSLTMRADASGSVGYAITLTQSLKKGGLTRGEVSLVVEGVQDGRLTELGWDRLRQDADAAPQEFAFRYFQQVEGSIMLPDGFSPQRVRVLVNAGGQRSERVFSWQDTQPNAQGV